MRTGDTTMISIQLGIQVHIPLQNKSLKPTVSRVTPFAEQTKPAPRYGGLVPPFYAPIVLGENLSALDKHK
jgi:hypothetical protein